MSTSEILGYTSTIRFPLYKCHNIFWSKNETRSAFIFQWYAVLNEVC